MILVDFSQVMFSNLAVAFKTYGAENFSFGVYRNMVVTSIRNYANQFGNSFGELVICCDGDRTKYWRLQKFPYYKHSRRQETKDEEEQIWRDLLANMVALQQELSEVLPCRFMCIENAEADDIIAVMSITASELSQERIVIVSADKDYIQLQRFQNVSQYSPTKKIWIRHDAPNRYRKEHIMSGDRGDGIPNFLSDDDCFVTGKRQTPLTKAKIEKWMPMKPEDFCDEKMLAGYKRNRSLIDFELIPTDVSVPIVKTFIDAVPANRAAFIAYLKRHSIYDPNDNWSKF